jgi:hypothetical protein
MNIHPLGPKQPKKPKSKSVAFLVNQEEVYGWIDADSDPIQGVEIFSVDDNQEYCTPYDGVYSLLSGDTLEILNGIIQ